MVFDILFVKGLSLGMNMLTEILHRQKEKEGKETEYKTYQAKTLRFEIPKTCTVKEQETTTTSHYTFQVPQGQQQYMITMVKYMETIIPCREAAQGFIEELKQQTKTNVKMVGLQWNQENKLRKDEDQQQPMFGYKNNNNNNQEKYLETKETRPCDMLIEFMHMETTFQRRMVVFYMEDNLVVFQHTVAIKNRDGVRASQGIDNTIGNYIVRTINLTERMYHGKLYAYVNRYRVLMPSPLYQITMNKENDDDDDDKEYILRAARRSPQNDLLEGFSIEPYHEAFLIDTIKEEDLYTRTLDDIGSQLGEIYDSFVEDVMIGNKKCKLVEYTSEKRNKNKSHFQFGELVMDTQSSHQETRMLCIRFFSKIRRYRRMRRQILKSLAMLTFTEQDNVNNDFLLYHHETIDFSIRIPRFMAIQDHLDALLTFAVGAEETHLHMATHVTETTFDFRVHRPEMQKEDDTRLATNITPTLKQNILHALNMQPTRVRILASGSEALCNYSKDKVYAVYYMKENSKGEPTSYYVTFILTAPGTLFRITSSQPGPDMHPTYMKMAKTIHHHFKMNPF